MNTTPAGIRAGMQGRHRPTTQSTTLKMETIPMNFKSLSNKVRPTVETEATALEQDLIIEELSDEEAVTVCGGGSKSKPYRDYTPYGSICICGCRRISSNRLRL